MHIVQSREHTKNRFHLNTFKPQNNHSFGDIKNENEEKVMA